MCSNKKSKETLTALIGAYKSLVQMANGMIQLLEDCRDLEDAKDPSTCSHRQAIRLLAMANGNILSTKLAIPVFAQRVKNPSHATSILFVAVDAMVKRGELRKISPGNYELLQPDPRGILEAIQGVKYESEGKAPRGRHRARSAAL